jgi:hypothetical protein
VFYVFFDGCNRQGYDPNLDGFLFLWWFCTIGKIQNNFPDGESSDICLFPCRASPDGYSLAVPVRKIGFAFVDGIFIFLTVIAPSWNFSFPVVISLISHHIMWMLAIIS